VRRGDAMAKIVCSGNDDASYSVALNKNEASILLKSFSFQSLYNNLVDTIMSRNSPKEENRNLILNLTKWVTEKEDNHIPLMWSINV
jgi:hypothetical protein